MKEQFIGAVQVLTNYLDGAIADYKLGSIQDTTVIDSCIATLKYLGYRNLDQYDNYKID